MKEITKHLIWIIPCLSVILLGVTMPLSGSYYAMPTTPWRIFYIISGYGFPIWTIIPVGLIASFIAIFWYRKLTYKMRVIKLTKALFIVISSLFLFINGALFISKFVLGNDPFPIQYYNEIIGSTQGMASIKNGVFKTTYGKIFRQGENHRVEYNSGEIKEYHVSWLKNGEHQLIYKDQNNYVNDTLWVKVTSIKNKYYECYYKLGELAEYDKIEIIE